MHEVVKNDFFSEFFVMRIEETKKTTKIN
jgi:hypothetical protein